MIFSHETCYVALKRTSSSNKEEVRVEEIINDIVGHNMFVRSQCSFPCNSVSDIYKCTQFMSYIYKCFPTLAEEYRRRSLYQNFMYFLVHSTNCILPQDRGFSTDEQGYLFWNLKTSEEKIMEAYLRYGRHNSIGVVCQLIYMFNTNV